MKKLYDWLANHKAWNIVILCCYFLMVVLPHEVIGVTISKVFKPHGRDFYNATILAISLVIALLIFVPFIKRVQQLENRLFISLYTLATVILIALCLNTIIIVNIELIHIFQYAVFAILAYPLFKHYTLTLIATTLFGAIDEGYQYFILSPQRTNYYDLNDVVFNTLGGGVGLLWIKSFSIESTKRSLKQFLISFSILSTLLLLGGIGLSIILGYMAYYPTEGIDRLYTWVREVPTEFWSSLNKGQIVYHVSLPIEGIIYTTLLWMFYSRLDA